MKRAQLIGQVFIYILTIIIFGAIILYGYRAIQKMGSRADEVLRIQLQKDISDAIEKIDYGSVTKKELMLPKKFNEICFVDLKRLADDDLEDYYPLVYDSWSEEAPANMFLIQDVLTVEPYYIGDITIQDEGWICIPSVQGKVAVRLEGKGKYVELSKWTGN